MNIMLLAGNGWMRDLLCSPAAYDVVFCMPSEVETRLRTAAGVAFSSLLHVVGF